MTENPGTTPPDGEQPSTPAAGAPTPPPPAEGAQPGAYPPPAPAPGYGAPAGGYPPPAEPAQPYGQQPPAAAPYPPQQPYGQQQPYAQPAYQASGPTVGVGEAFNWGWTKFTQNVGPLLLGVLAYLVVIGVIAGIFFAILAAAAAASDPYGSSSGLAALSGFTGLLFTGVLALLSVFMQAGVIRATLEIANGRPVEFATFFKFTDFGKVILAALLVGVGTAVGYLLLWLPGLVFAFFAQFTLYFVIDKGLDAVDALKASFTLVNRNLGTVVVLFLGVYVANAIGSALCGVGLLVSFPVGLLATAYLFRRIQNEPVAA
jgi:uncharacterized membrane protein